MLISAIYVFAIISETNVSDFKKGLLACWKHTRFKITNQIQTIIPTVTHISRLICGLYPCTPSTLPLGGNAFSYIEVNPKV